MHKVQKHFFKKAFIVHLRELSSDHKAEDNKHQEAVVLHFFVASREPI